MIMDTPANQYGPALVHLSSVDPDWARLLNLIGPCTHRPNLEREPYEALIRAVAYQQLHARAADAIISRFLKLFPDLDSTNMFPAPVRILTTTFDDLRACGFSARKISAIRGIAESALSGKVPSRPAAIRMQDEELIERLVTLPGIGRWTVEMLLIFTLERMDVMPADDYGVRAGYRLLKSLEAVPNRKEMEKAGMPCSPYRTIAAWYLWRIASFPGYISQKNQ
ncbi:MAG: DNA-3-methyladenine glycosylase 2 family protein [Nitrosospira sp.]|nr:DNA-3-methyladenine glycosylase 2 family protein [Nitrosospira sp.]